MIILKDRNIFYLENNNYKPTQSSNLFVQRSFKKLWTGAILPAFGVKELYQVQPRSPIEGQPPQQKVILGNNMIINHKYKFIFIKTKKVAGTSLEIALSKFCDQNDIISPIVEKDEQLRRKLGFQGPCNHENLKFWNHITARELKELISPDVWNNYTKITCVRNTYDQLISRFFWNTNGHGRPGTQHDFDVWYKKFFEQHGATGSNWDIYSIDGKAAMDVYLMYHTLEEDCSKLSEQLGLPGDLGELIQTIKTKDTSRKVQWPPVSDETFAAIRNDGLNEIQEFGFTIPEYYRESTRQ